MVERHLLNVCVDGFDSLLGFHKEKIMGHYASELANTREDDKAFREIEQKYARMSQKELDRIRRDMWLDVLKDCKENYGYKIYILKDTIK